MKAGSITVSLGGGVDYSFTFGYGKLNQFVVARTTFSCTAK